MANRCLSRAPATHFLFLPFQNIWENSEVYANIHGTCNLFQVQPHADWHVILKSSFCLFFFFMGNLENINQDSKMVAAGYQS